jgi:hypothetical protein
VTLKAVILSCKYPIFGAVYTIVSGIAAGKPCAADGFWFPVWMLLIATLLVFGKEALQSEQALRNGRIISVLSAMYFDLIKLKLFAGTGIFSSENT